MKTDPALKLFYKNLARLLVPREDESSAINDLAVLVPELKEISEIIEKKLYLSGCLPVTETKLNALGITAIVCVMSEEEERRYCKYYKNNKKINRLAVRLIDRTESDLSPFFPLTSSFIDRELKRGGKVLVHCVAGASRSVSVVLAYLITFQGYNSYDAYIMVQKKRNIARPNDGFCYQLMEYERSMSENSAIVSAKTISEVATKNEYFEEALVTRL